MSNLSVSKNTVFVPLNEFELLEIQRMIALRESAVNSNTSANNEILMQLSLDILSNSLRFTRFSSKPKRFVEATVFYGEWETVGNVIYYVKCNNGMYLYFNKKAELVARS